MEPTMSPTKKAPPPNADLNLTKHTRAPRLVHVMRDEPPQSGVGLVQPPGERARRQAWAVSTAHAPNRSVNPLPGLAHGAGAVLAPCTGHVTRGMVAWTNTLYRKKSGCRHTRSLVSCTGQAVSGQPVSGQWKRAPGPKTIATRGSRPPSPASLKSTDPTFQGSRNCNASVNRQEASMPPTHPPASPHTTTTHHKQRKAIFNR